MALKTTEEKFTTIGKMALELNAAMPIDVFLKGDGVIWVQMHGNDGVRPRPATQ